MVKKNKKTTIDDLARMVQGGFVNGEKRANERFDKMNKRFDKMDKRFDKVDGKFEDIWLKLDSLER